MAFGTKGESGVRTRSAETRKKMEAKNRNARSALNLSHVLPPVIPFQFQMEPQLLSYCFYVSYLDFDFGGVMEEHT